MIFFPHPFCCLSVLCCWSWHLTLCECPGLQGSETCLFGTIFFLRHRVLVVSGSVQWVFYSTGFGIVLFPVVVSAWEKVLSVLCIVWNSKID